MVSMECPCELEAAITTEFDVQIVLEFDGDVSTLDASLPEEAPADWDPSFDEGAIGLAADAGRDIH